MPFYKEPKGYAKTALSDLQGAWGNLRELIVVNAPFPEWKILLFHVDEAMSWESVRNLERMRIITACQIYFRHTSGKTWQEFLSLPDFLTM